MMHLYSAFRNWQERRRFFRDLDRQADDESAMLVHAIKDELTVAVTAVKNGDLGPALQIWTNLLNRHPHETKASPLAFEILLGLGYLDEAEALMRQGDKDHPTQPRFLTGLTLIARKRHDWDNLMRLSAALRKRFPTAPEGYLTPAEELRSLNRLDEAEALTRKAIRRASDDVRCFSCHAEIAFDRGNWHEALKRYQLIANRFDHMIGHIGVVRALQKLGRDAESNAALEQLALEHPSEMAPRIELACLAQASGDTEVAIKRWADIGGCFSSRFSICILASDRLQQLGAMDRAERILRFAVECFREEQSAYVHLASLLSGQQRYMESAEIWASVRTIFPDMESAYVKGAEAFDAAGLPGTAVALRDEWVARLNA